MYGVETVFVWVKISLAQNGNTLHISHVLACMVKNKGRHYKAKKPYLEPEDPGKLSRHGTVILETI